MISRTVSGGSAGEFEALLPPAGERLCFHDAWTSLSVDNTRADIEALCTAKHLPEGGYEAVSLIRHHIVPLAVKPPVNGSAEWAPRVRAMIDISDGLGRDLTTLCAESGVGAVISEDKIPVPASVAGVMEGERDKLTRFALSSGEEYVALASVEPGAVPPGAVVIGAVTEEAGGLLLEDADGGMRPLPPVGYEHEF